MANRLMVGLSGSAEDKSAVVIIPIRRSRCGWSLQGHDVRTQKIYHFLHPQPRLHGNLKNTYSRMHSGTIRVRNTTGPGKSGTVFSVFLPESAAQPARSLRQDSSATTADDEKPA